MDCDVLVVGAGPAGCAAARACSKRGLRTILVDKKEEVGVPVKCGEGIGSYLLKYLPFRIPKNQLEWKINGMSFYVEDILIERFGNFWGGYSIDRRKFDRWLANEAVRAGAKLLTRHELVDLQLNGDSGAEAYFRLSEGEQQIRAKYIVAADGADSEVSKILDLNKIGKSEVGWVYSWEVKNIKLYNAGVEQIFMGDYIPAGYAYIFPKSKNSANIGIGGFYSKRRLKQYFDEFLNLKFVKSQVKDSTFVVEKSGRASVGGKRLLGYKNIFFCGESANQNLKPFIEGILPAIICGDVAGNSIGLGVEDYRKRLEFIFGDFLRDSGLYEKALFRIWDLDRTRRYLTLALIASGSFPVYKLEELRDLDLRSLKDLLKSRRDIKLRWKEFFWYNYIQMLGSIKKLVSP